MVLADDPCLGACRFVELTVCSDAFSTVSPFFQHDIVNVEFWTSKLVRLRYMLKLFDSQRSCALEGSCDVCVQMVRHFTELRIQVPN